MDRKDGDNNGDDHDEGGEKRLHTLQCLIWREGWGPASVPTVVMGKPETGRALLDRVSGSPSLLSSPEVGQMTEA